MTASGLDGGARLRVTAFVVPLATDAVDAEEFVAMADLANRVSALDAGIDDLTETAEERLPFWLDQTDRIRRGFVARLYGEVVGAGTITTATQPGTTSAELELAVLPPHTRSGVGRALLDRLEREALQLGRSSLQAWTLHPASAAGRTIRPATGWGAVAATELSDLLEANGYALEQVERNSVLRLDVHSDAIARRLADAIAFAGPDYRVVSWTLPTPPELRAGYGDMIARMSTDVPSGDLDTAPEAWDDARVARRDAQILASGQTLSVSAVVHRPTGRMVAFNELVRGGEPTGVTHQWGTLVAADHRGRRLGTVVKCANLLRWRDIAPESRTVSTFNAEENRAMLDINEAIGFVPASYAGGWQKRVGSADR